MYLWNIEIKTNLTARQIPRLNPNDLDLFIETHNMPVELDLELPGYSRIQFPMSRAVLVRATKESDRVTCHILRDIDLYSSFANFEINLQGKCLCLMEEEGKIRFAIVSREKGTVE